MGLLKEGRKLLKKWKMERELTEGEKTTIYSWKLELKTTSLNDNDKEKKKEVYKTIAQYKESIQAGVEEFSGANAKSVIPMVSYEYHQMGKFEPIPANQIHITVELVYIE